MHIKIGGRLALLGVSVLLTLQFCMAQLVNQPTPGTQIDAFDTPNQLQLGASILLTNSHVTEGSYALKMVSSVGSVAFSDRTLPSLDMSGMNLISLWVYAEPSVGVQPSMTLYFTSTASFSRYYAFNFVPKNSGWNKIYIRRAQFTSPNGESWSNPMIIARIRSAAISGKQSIVYLDDMRMNQYFRPQIIVGFDDNLASSYTDGVLYMSQYGMVGTTYVIGMTLQQPQNLSYCSPTQLQDAYNRGWDISNHSYTHQHFAGSSYQTVLNEFGATRDVIASYGWVRDDCHLQVAYPYGETSTNIYQAMADLGTETGRGTAGGIAFPFGPMMIVNAQIVGGTGDFVVSSAINKINEAMATGGTVPLLLHKVINDGVTPATNNEVNRSDFRALIDYLNVKRQTGELDVIPMTKWYKNTIDDSSWGVINVDVTVQPATKTIGDNDPPLTYTFSPALFPGDSFTGALQREGGEDAGDYEITQGTLKLPACYRLRFHSANLTIAPKTITVRADAKQKVYGDADPALTYTVSPALGIGPALSGSLSRAPGSDVGSYPINQGTLSGDGNYTIQFESENLTITPKPVTVQADAKRRLYGDSDPPLTYSVSPALVAGDTFSGSLARDTGDHVGSYAINQGTLALSNNYSLTYLGANFTINPRPLTVTADDLTKTFGDTDPTLTVHITSGNLVGSDALSGSPTRDSGEDVGDYAVHKGTVSAGSDYDLQFVDGHLHITARPVTVAADPLGKTYGEADPALTYHLLSGTLRPGDSFSGLLARVPGENVGSYAIEKGTLTLGSNYALTVLPNLFSIGQRAASVTPDPASKIVGEPDPAFTGTLTGFLPADNVTATYSRTPGESVDLSPYTISAQLSPQAVLGNYAITYGTAEFAIHPGGGSPLSLMAIGDDLTAGIPVPGGYRLPLRTKLQSSGYSITYMGSSTINDPEDQVGLFHEGLVNGGIGHDDGERPGVLDRVNQVLAPGTPDPNVLLLLVGSDELNTTDDIAGAPQRMYELINTIVTYKPDMEVLVGLLPHNYSGHRDAYVQMFNQQVGGPGGVIEQLRLLGHKVTGVDFYNGIPSSDFSDPLHLNADGYEKMATLWSTVMRRRLELDFVTLAADAKTKTYGDPDPDLTFRILPGALIGDTTSGGLQRDGGEDVGQYAIHQGTLTLQSHSNVTFQGAELTILPKTITVRAAAKQVVYGDPEPALTYTFDPPLVGSDAFSGELTREPGQHVGTYRIKQGTLHLPANYTLNFEEGDLTIEPKPITINADAKTKQYGDEDPEFSYQIVSGSLQPGDSLSGSLDREAGESVGTYAIRQGSLSGGADYSITFAGANLEITARPVVIKIDSKTKSYGDADPVFTATAVPPLVAGDHLVGLPVREPGENVGTYTVYRGSLNLPNANYAATYEDGSLQIQPRLITVTANPQFKQPGEPDPALTVAVVGTLLAGDAISGAATRDPGEDPGTYAIRQGSLSVGPNYALAFVESTLRIAHFDLTIMPLGDSLTSGYPVPGGYREKLMANLAASGKSVRMLGTQWSNPSTNLPNPYHNGFNGATIFHDLAGHAGLYEPARDMLLAPGTLDPDVVLLLAGTNDVLANHDLATAPQRLKSLIDLICQLKPGAKVVVGSLPHLLDPAQNALAHAFNTALLGPGGILQQEVQAGHNVVGVDHYSAVSPNNYSDLVHPNKAGYDQMADAWTTAVQGRSMTLQAELQDYTPGPSGIEADIEIRWAGQSELLTTARVTLDADGVAKFPFPYVGIFDFRISAAGWLSQTLQISVGNQGGDLYPSLFNGDIDGDNAVTVFDYGILSDYFDLTSDDPSWLEVGSNGFAPVDADVDGDGVVSVFDYGVISQNFDFSGD